MTLSTDTASWMTEYLQIPFFPSFWMPHTKEHGARETNWGVQYPVQHLPHPWAGAAMATNTLKPKASHSQLHATVSVELI